MTRRPQEAPKEIIGGAFLSLVSVCLSELRTDFRRLCESNWAEPERRRAHELSTTLWEACARQGLHPLSRLSRSMASLIGLSREEALPLQPALREKFEELLNSAQGLLADCSKRRSGIR